MAPFARRVQLGQRVRIDRRDPCVDVFGQRSRAAALLDVGDHRQPGRVLDDRVDLKGDRARNLNRAAFAVAGNGQRVTNEAARRQRALDAPAEIEEEPVVAARHVFIRQARQRGRPADEHIEIRKRARSVERAARFGERIGGRQRVDRAPRVEREPVACDPGRARHANEQSLQPAGLLAEDDLLDFVAQPRIVAGGRFCDGLGGHVLVGNEQTLGEQGRVHGRRRAGISGQAQHDGA